MHMLCSIAPSTAEHHHGKMSLHTGHVSGLKNWGWTHFIQEWPIMIITRSMQGMFGASVSKLYLLIKLLINTERTVDLCVVTKKKYTHTQELWVRPDYNIQACRTQAGPAHAAGHGNGMDRWQHSSHPHMHRAVVRRGWSPATDTDTMSQATKTVSTDCHAIMSITLATE